MSKNAKRELVKKVKQRYLHSSKIEKTHILTELCINTGYKRKYALSLLSARKSLEKIQNLTRKSRWSYTEDDIGTLRKIWRIFDYPCGQRLAPMLKEYIRVLEKWNEISLTKETKERILKISSSTIDRRLKKTKQEEKRKIFSTTKPGSMLKSHIPIKTSSWDEKRVGFGELDTVAHCGSSASGDFLSSLNYTDIATQWTETVAVMGKSQKNITQGLEEISGRLPFALLGIDPDNGSEFINWQLFTFCAERGIEFTRGRPYHKNDNAHIEQKNYTHVRKLSGYKRLHTQEELESLNGLYANEWRLFKNFFEPNKKLVEKKRIGSRIVKKYDIPKTPYQRILDHADVCQDTKDGLQSFYDTLNPAELKRCIDKKIQHL